jgi:NADPH:quinone reductase-like Zn-dependent oxidoreductase
LEYTVRQTGKLEGDDAMKAVVLHARGELPRYEEVPDPVPLDGEELVTVAAAPVNAIDRSRAAGSHYSVRSGPGSDLPAVVGVIGAGRLAAGKRVLFGSRLGTMAEYSVVRQEMTFPIPDDVDDALAAAVWNPGLSAWLTLRRRAGIQPGETVLVLGATGVTGKLAVQLAKRFGAGRVIAAGRNEQVLDELTGLGADATIRLGQSEEDVAKAFTAEAGEGGYDLVVDYLWGRPTEILLGTIGRHDITTRSLRTRLVHVGSMAGPEITLRAEVLRSAGLEILGMGTGTMPPLDVITSTLGELLGLVGSGEVRVDVDRVPMSGVQQVWSRDQRGRRPVLIP